MSDVLHVVPINDTYRHDDAVWCPCKPAKTESTSVANADYRGVVYIHHSWDGREHREPDQQARPLYPEEQIMSTPTHPTGAGAEELERQLNEILDQPYTGEDGEELRMIKDLDTLFPNEASIQEDWDNHWPKLMPYIHRYCAQRLRELAMYPSNDDHGNEFVWLGRIEVAAMDEEQLAEGKNL